MLLVACYNQHGTIHDATLLKATVACYKVASRMVALTHQWIEEDTGTCQVFRFVRICCRATCICQLVAWEAISLNKMVQRKVPLGFSRALTA